MVSVDHTGVIWSVARDSEYHERMEEVCVRLDDPSCPERVLVTARRGYGCCVAGYGRAGECGPWRGRDSNASLKPEKVDKHRIEERWL